MIYDVANAVDINGDPVACLETLWPRLGIVRLSESPKGQWRHDPIGTGAVDFAAIGALLRRKGFEGAVVLEILSGAPLRGLTDGVAALQALGFSFQETIKRIDA